jgi:amino acid adenylation domain-containing protein
MAAFEQGMRPNYIRQIIFKPMSTNEQTIEQPTTAGFRLSPLQEHFWSVQIGNEAGCPQSVCAIRIEGQVALAKVKDAVQKTIHRHEILRTAFVRRPGMKIPFQVISDECQPEWQVSDLTTLSQDQQEQEIERCIAEEVKKIAECELSPCIGAHWIQLRDDRHTLVLSLPCLCADRSSLRILATNIAEFLNSREQDVEIVQYVDMAEWQHSLLESSTEPANRAKAFWRSQQIVALTLPLERKTKERLGAEFIPIEASQGLASNVDVLAATLNASSEDVLLAAWQTLLWRLSGQSRPTVYTSFAGREHEQMQGSIGLFSRSLPITARFDGSLRFDEVVEQMRFAREQAAGYQEFYLPNSHGGNEGPVLFEYEAWRETDPIGSLKVSLLQTWGPTEFYKVKLICHRENGGLLLELHYDSGYFARPSAQRIAQSFQVLLTAALTNSQQKTELLPMLSDEDRKQVLDVWNQTNSKYSNGSTIHALFEQQVEKYPDRAAVVCSGQHLTYAELNRKANQLAHYLRKAGVHSDVLAGLFLDRSTELMVALLGILKAGGAYVGFNPGTPKLHLAKQLVGLKVLVTEEKLLPQLPQDFSGDILCVDRDYALLQNEPEENLVPVANAESLVYVIYTSGSTGIPKGVAVRHRNLVNYSEFICNRLRLPIYREGLKFASVSTIAADLGNTCIYPALISGGCLHLISYETSTDSRRMAEYQQHHQIDVLKIVPSHLKALLNSDEGTRILPRRYLICGGEALPWSLVEQIRNSSAGCELINHYGPTETTVGSLTLSFMESPSLGPEQAATAPIGRPIANTRVYVLGQQLQPVPVGVAGELYIAGAGVTAGYLGQQERTEEQFLVDPFAGQAEARMYRTGDVARYLEDGNVEFLGRVDDQVKVRGFRIELGEIESALLRQPGVKQAVVLGREEKDTLEKRLVAYLVLDRRNPTDSATLLTRLKEQLPEYMVPSALVVLEKLPLTSNGKVDRMALPKPEESAGHQKTYVAPGTPTEQIVAMIWAEVLRVQQIGCLDDFFQMGGHSLLATQVVSRIRRTLNVELPLRALFECSTVAKLSKHIDHTRRAQESLSIPAMTRVSREQALPLSFTQQRLWILDQIEPNNPLYNIPRPIRITGPLNSDALQNSLNQIVSRHESLRTTFHTVDRQPVQVIAEFVNLTVETADLSLIPEAEREAEARRLAAQEAVRPFNLTQAPLLRAKLLRLEAEDHVLLLTMHHIVSDAWSAAVFQQEFIALYQASSSGTPCTLPELTIQYVDYAYWQRQWLQGKTLETQLTFWRDQLAGAPPVLTLPTDRPRPQIRTFRGGHHTAALPKSLVEELNLLSRREGVTLFMTLLAVFQMLLARYSGQEDIVIGTDVANRPTIETERLIGVFINLLPLRCDLSGNPTFGALLGRVRNNTLACYAHQEMPFDKLVEELRPDRNLGQNPLVQVLFVMQNTPRATKEFGGLKLSRFDMPITQAKFDVAVFASENDKELGFHWIYSADLFDPGTVLRMSQHYENLLRSVVARPDSRLDTFEMLSTEEKERQSAEKKERKQSHIKKLMTAEPKVVSFAETKAYGE